MWKISAQTAVGKKYSRLIPCAVRCSSPQIAVIQTISSVPPPMPSPESTPQTSPASAGRSHAFIAAAAAGRPRR